MADDSIDLSLLRASVLDASLVEVGADSAFRQARRLQTFRRSPAGTRPLANPDSGGSFSPARRQPDPPAPFNPSPLKLAAHHSPDDGFRQQSSSISIKPRRMTAGNTQRSDRTDVLSQWVYEPLPTQDCSHVAATEAFRTAPETRTYNTGDLGHVEFELDGVAVPNPTFETQDADDLPDLALEVEEHLTELYPQSQRFQQPKTPASNGRKRKRGSDGINPFGSSAIKNAGPMRMSQIFDTSSPFTNHLPSDPPPSRPSPNFNGIERPSTAQALSSPARPAPGRRAVTEPHTNWKSDHERTSISGDSLSEHSLHDDENAFESEFDFPSSQARRMALQAEKSKASLEVRSARENPDITGPLSNTKQSLSRKSPASHTPRLGRAVPQTDPTESEDETDIEASPPHEPKFSEDGDNTDELGDNNKENFLSSIDRRSSMDGVYIRSASKPQKRQSARASKLNYSRRADSQSGDELATPLPTRSQQHDIMVSQNNDQKTIADSQQSSPPKVADLSLPPDRVPRSTDDSGKVIRESQTLRAAASSPSVGTLKGRVAVASSLSLSASSPHGRPSHTSKRDNSPTDDKPAGPRRMNGLDGRGSAIGELRTLNSTETPSRNMFQPMSVPETNMIARFQRPEPLSRALAGERLSQSSSKAHNPTAEGMFNDSSTHNQTKGHVEQPSSLVTPDSSQPSTGPNVSQPIPLTEIGRAANASPEASLSFSPEILKTNDPLYDEVMEKYSSPVSAAQKRRAREETARNQQSKSVAFPTQQSFRQSSDVDLSQCSHQSRASVTFPTASQEQNGTFARKENINVETPPDQAVEEATAQKETSLTPSTTTEKNSRKIARHHELPPSHRRGSAEPAVEAEKVLPSRQDTFHPQQRSRISRVFAYFSSARPGFYPATCVALSATEPRFTVRFDDSNVTHLTSTKVKPLELRQGDSVRIDRKGFRNINYIVKRCEREAEPGDDLAPTDNRGNSEVVLCRSTSSTKDGEEEAFPIGAVYLTHQTWTALKREFSPADIALLASELNLSTPTEFPASPITPTSRGRASRSELKESAQLFHHGQPDSKAGLFGNMLFVLTNIDPPSVREELISSIGDQGGTVAGDGFEGFFEHPNQDECRPPTPASRTTPTKRGHTSSATAEATQLQSEPREGRDLQPHAHLRHKALFLLATRHCRHSKYLHSLALGVPCVSMKWIEHSIQRKTVLPWRSYLLASGESALLDQAVISQVPAIAPSSRFTLPDLIARRPKLLAGARVILLSLDSARASHLDAHRFLSLALGAVEVSRAASLDTAHAALTARNNHASSRNPWTLVIVNASDVVDTRACNPPPPSSARPAKRKKGTKKEREDDAEGVVETLAALVAPYAGVRGVSTEFVIQSLILGRLL